MGAVYVVEQLSTGKRRALKVMVPELAADPATRDRFVWEAKVAGQIDSDHVVEIVTAGVDEQTGSLYLVMELLKGNDLGVHIAERGPLPLASAAEGLVQICHALSQAHAQGIVHRDLKPDNIFVAQSRRSDTAFTLKILDFGIAKLVAGANRGSTQPLGTPLYMSPEQTDPNGRICPATDVWALGLIMFKALTGIEFWRTVEGAIALLFREICFDPIPKATDRARELGCLDKLPRGFDEWFARCVTREIDARFQEAGAAAAGFWELVPVDQRGQVPSARVVDELSTFHNTLSLGKTAPVFLGNTSSVGGKASTKKVAIASAFGGVTVLGALIGMFLALRPVAPVPSGVGSASPSASMMSAVTAPALACPAGMVKIAGGKTFLGARDLGEDAQPPHEVMLSAFCIDKTEVTTASYMACVATGSCERPPERVDWPGITEPKRQLFSQLCNAGAAGREQHPINCVNWDMAQGYCAQRGARLPTEAEWEFTARGPSQRTFPWGSEPPDATRLNACGSECDSWGKTVKEPMRVMFSKDDGFAATSPVGSFPLGASEAGVLDLSGNVSEWVSDWFAPYDATPKTDPKGPSVGSERVVRGGAFGSFDVNWTKPAFRWKTGPRFSHGIGFRCASNVR